MLSEIKIPGVGIGRGRGRPKVSENGAESAPRDGVVSLGRGRLAGRLKAASDTERKCLCGDEAEVLRPPRVSYIPDDDMEEYRLHVGSGANFEKFEAAKVTVTGDSVPPSIAALGQLSFPHFLSDNISKLGFKALTSVQKHTIPIIAARRDVMACAETGSGKTAAFLLPIIAAVYKLKKVSSSERTSPHCLIIVPSRELCRQVFTAAMELCKSTDIKCSYGYGGVEMTTSLSKLYQCDILCITPGRLVQYVNGDVILLDRLSYLVLDEADKLLGLDYFQESVRLVLTNARDLNNRDLQVSLFSATFPRSIQLLAQEILKNYLFVAVGIVGAANSDISQTLLPATASNKLDLTLNYIANHKLGKTLIFVKRKRLADFYGIRLIEMGLATTTIHGDRLQADREKALNDFKSGRVDVLVATDVASRGLDIPHVDTVLNVDMPDDVDLYVHRIGRSGRCGNPGSAVTFFDVEEDYYQAPRLLQILKGSKQPIPEFLSQLGSGFKVRDSLKSSMKDLRVTKSKATIEVSNTFMNLQEDSEEEGFL